VAASLAEAIEGSIGLPTKIKWPNDIYLTERKVAGILAESGTDANGQPFAVVGIGVNVNHELHDFPRELDGKAGSIRMATGRMIDRPSLATALLRALDARFPQMSTDFPRIMADVTRRSLLLGRWVQLRAGHTVLEGRAESLDADGHLLLRKTDGTLNRLTAGEVTVIAD
jgi:BirA family biotin operon repressor/biotin-[acetyl-CoA-carboxylase] ligase